jgi:hypothetical protein
MVKSVSEKLTLKVKAMGTQYDQNYYLAPFSHKPGTSFFTVHVQYITQYSIIVQHIMEKKLQRGKSTDYKCPNCLFFCLLLKPMTGQTSDHLPTFLERPTGLKHPSDLFDESVGN